MTIKMTVTSYVELEEVESGICIECGAAYEPPVAPETGDEASGLPPIECLFCRMPTVYGMETALVLDAIELLEG